MNNIKVLLAALLMFEIFPAVNAQEQDQKIDQHSMEAKSYRVIFQLVSGDTLAHKALMRQLNNLLTVDPKIKIEVVCHGPGLDLLHKDKSQFANGIQEMLVRGIVFDACEFSMKERKVAKEQLLPGIATVPAGIYHIVKKQSEGWYYIKAGF
ncbi:MAG: DsrE family protein [Saprospiraceae bacterium]|nr:DsrE family protein [Candidatus Vicinibacter proximus]MBL7823213.1 DsrE family protein [Saprospiraceae bacterium]